MQSLILILFFQNSEISHLLLSFINNIQRFIFSWGIIWSQFHIASNGKHVRRFRSRFKHYGKFIKFTFKHNIKLQINNKIYFNSISPLLSPASPLEPSDTFFSLFWAPLQQTLKTSNLHHCTGFAYLVGNGQIVFINIILSKVNRWWNILLLILNALLKSIESMFMDSSEIHIMWSVQRRNPTSHASVRKIITLLVFSSYL